MTPLFWTFIHKKSLETNEYGSIFYWIDFLATYFVEKISKVQKVFFQLEWLASHLLFHYMNAKNLKIDCLGAIAIHVRHWRSVKSFVFYHHNNWRVILRFSRVRHCPKKWPYHTVRMDSPLPSNLLTINRQCRILAKYSITWLLPKSGGRSLF